MGAECGLFKVDRHELVPVDLVHNKLLLVVVVELVDLVHSATESPSPFRISETASFLEF